MMKIIEHTATKLTLRDSAGCLWLLGLFFIAVAGSFVVGLMGAFTNLNELSELEKLLGWFISLSGVAAGVWIIYTNPGVLVNFDKNNNTAIVNRRGLLKNETENYSLNEIADVVLDETIDTEGDPFYKIALILNTERKVRLFSTGLHDRETQQKNVDFIKQFLKT